MALLSTEDVKIPRSLCVLYLYYLPNPCLSILFTYPTPISPCLAQRGSDNRGSTVPWCMQMQQNLAHFSSSNLSMYIQISPLNHLLSFLTQALEELYILGQQVQEEMDDRNSAIVHGHIWKLSAYLIDQGTTREQQLLIHQVVAFLLLVNKKQNRSDILISITMTTDS